MLKNFERLLSHMRSLETSLAVLNMTTLEADTKKRRNIKDHQIHPHHPEDRQIQTKANQNHPIIKGLKVRRILSTIVLTRKLTRKGNKDLTTTGK